MARSRATGGDRLPATSSAAARLSARARAARRCRRPTGLGRSHRRSARRAHDTGLNVRDRSNLTDFLRIANIHSITKSTSAARDKRPQLRRTARVARRAFEFMFLLKLALLGSALGRRVCTLEDRAFRSGRLVTARALLVHSYRPVGGGHRRRTAAVSDSRLHRGGGFSDLECCEGEHPGRRCPPL